MSLVLQSSGGGQITIQEPTTASNFTQTLPAATGTVMVSGNQPAFSATKTGSDQNLSNATFTKITFNSEEFDTNNNFASSTFTPTVAGYYQINASIQCFSTVGTATLISIYKNGSEYSRCNQLGLSSGSMNLFMPLAANLIYMNGSTDYLEIYGYINATSGQIVSASGSTFFSGCLVRSA
jgi:hypothetical protein